MCCKCTDGGDWEIVSESSISTNNIPTEIYLKFVEKTNQIFSVLSYRLGRISLDKKVCLTCNTCVDEIEILKECVKEYKERKLLAKKMWDNCKGD